jgi:hypothetical protein
MLLLADKTHRRQDPGSRERTIMKTNNESIKDITLQDDGNPAVVSISAIPAEEPRRIEVGKVGSLSVPSEDIGADDNSRDIDFTDSMTMQIRRPGRHEWIAFLHALWIHTRLLALQAGPNGLETAYYFVREGPARDLVREDLVGVKVIPYYSFTQRAWKLWIVNVTDSSWYQSLQPLFEQDANFYQGAAFRVVADRNAGRYRIRTKEAPGPLPKAPAKPVGDMLGEALGPLRFVDSPEHQVIRDLIAGEEF